jgi:membrane fusion protein, copper/silver efflux system
MALVPKYAEKGNSAGVSIDSTITQNLGMRLASVRSASLATAIEAVGVLGFNERDVAVIQARSSGYVERVYGRAAGDILATGSPLVDLLVPEWAAAQAEFLALRAHGDERLLAAARQRLRLSGLPSTLIERVERTGKPQSVITLTTPIAGVLQELNIRVGMTVTTGQTLARLNGLDPVWLEVSVPEAQAGALRLGQTATVRFVAFPGDGVHGLVSTILPETRLDSRTLKVRIELPNPAHRLKPGMTAHVHLESGGTQTALRVPTEAVIRTGKRALVILAEAGGRYRPVLVTLGPEIDEETVILSGLALGQQVVASGQFLIDSEARLGGISAPEPNTNTPIEAPGDHP